jgi:hypothetical protein
MTASIGEISNAVPPNGAARHELVTFAVSPAAHEYRA